MIRSFLFVIMMLGAFGAASSSAFGALVAYIWFALFRPQDWVWIYVDNLRLSLVLGVMLLVQCFARGKWPNVSHRNTFGILLILLCASYAQIDAISQDTGMRWLDFLARLTLVTALLVTLVDTPRRLFWVVLTIATSFGYHTTKAGFASILGGGLHYSAGLSGAFVDNNGYAVGAAMIMPLLWAVGVMVPREWRYGRWIAIGYFITVPLTAYAVISTFSRGGFLALAVGVLTFVILNWRRAPTLAGVLVIGILIAPAIPLPEGYADRLSTIQNYDEAGEGSAMSRLHFWRVAWEMAKDHPFGVGLFNFEPNYDRYDFSYGGFGRRRSVHNSHLQILSETGFLGFGVWVMLFVGSLWTCMRIRRKYMPDRKVPGSPGRLMSMLSDGLVMSMTSFLAGGMFIAMGLNDITWMLFGIVAAMDRLSRRIPSVAAEPGILLPPRFESSDLRRAV